MNIHGLFSCIFLLVIDFVRIRHSSFIVYSLTFSLFCVLCFAIAFYIFNVHFCFDWFKFSLHSRCSHETNGMFVYMLKFSLFLYKLSITFDWYFLTGTSSAIALESNLFFMSLFTATVLNLKCCNYDWNYSWNIIDIFIEFPQTAIGLDRADREEEDEGRVGYFLSYTIISLLL